MRVRYALPLAVTLLLMLAACSGGGDPAGSAAVSVSVEDEFTFKPATIVVGAGESVDITLENTGSVDHSLYILKADAELEHVLEEEDEEHVHEELLFDIHDTAPGERSTAAFTAPAEAGDYVIACLVPGHAAAGMIGTLRVTP